MNATCGGDIFGFIEMIVTRLYVSPHLSGEEARSVITVWNHGSDFLTRHEVARNPDISPPFSSGLKFDNF